MEHTDNTGGGNRFAGAPEAQRRKALALRGRGLSFREVGEMLDVHKDTVGRWVREAKGRAKAPKKKAPDEAPRRAGRPAKPEPVPRTPRHPTDAVIYRMQEGMKHLEATDMWVEMQRSWPAHKIETRIIALETIRGTIDRLLVKVRKAHAIRVAAEESHAAHVLATDTPSPQEVPHEPTTPRPAYAGAPDRPAPAPAGRHERARSR